MVVPDGDGERPAAAHTGKVFSFAEDRHPKDGISTRQDGQAATRLVAHLPEDIDNDFRVSSHA